MLWLVLFLCVSINAQSEFVLPAGSNTFFLATFPALRVTEMMINPAEPTGAEDFSGFEETGMFEYIEFRNVGPTAFDLKGIVLTCAVDFTFPGLCTQRLLSHFLSEDDSAW